MPLLSDFIAPLLCVPNLGIGSQNLFFSVDGDEKQEKASLAVLLVSVSLFVCGTS